MLDEVIASGGATMADVPRMLLVFLGAFAITSSFAVWTASSLELPTFLLLAPLSARRRWWRIGIYGVGGGILIYLTNELYLTTAPAPFRPSLVYDLDSHLKVFALSARAAFVEETMFRLFAITFFVSLGMRLYGWRPRFGFDSNKPSPEPAVQRPPRRLVLIALIASALLFGMSHSANPVAAAAFGLLLGVVYLRSGWEGAVTAHFLGNYLLFAGIYL